MTSAPINIGMRAAIYDEQPEADRGPAVRERYAEQPLMPQSRSPDRLS